MSQIHRVQAVGFALAIGALVIWGASALTTAYAEDAHSSLQKATFAGGCFWSMERAFHDIPGVETVTAGYTGGHVPHPTYEQVSEGSTGHLEAVQISYDPKKVTYPQLLDAFWHHVDPLDDRGQFCDTGPEYRSRVF